MPTTAGTIKRVSVYGRTRDECHAKYVKPKAQADDGIPVASVSWTVEQNLGYWLKHVVRVERRPKTVQGYESVVRLHIIPALGKKRSRPVTCGSSSPTSVRCASAAGTGGTRSGTNRAAALSRAGSAASVPALGADGAVRSSRTAQRPTGGRS
ncbi:hypothetical protein [Actinomadura vinacea]